MNWEQIQAILWLRWRLSANQFSRHGKLNAAFAVAVLLLGVSGAAASAIGGVFLGLSFGDKAPPIQLLVAWHGIFFAFLVFWTTGLLIQIQRSESIDLTRLLHLPLHLRQVFIFNYLVSFLTPSLVLMLPGMLGFAAGLTLSRGPAMLLTGGLVLAAIFPITAWTYCLRGWLAALMVNKRRRQSVIVWVTLVFILVFQVPNLVMQSGRWKRARMEAAMAARQSTDGKPTPKGSLPPALFPIHLLLPPAWVGYGTLRLAEGKLVPALAGILGGTLLGAWGIGRAYRVTLRFHQGAEKASASAAPASPRRRSTRLVERRLPLLPDDIAALALASLRATLRAPELKMALLAPIFVVVGGFSALGAGMKGTNPGLIHTFATSGAVLLGVFSFTSLAANTFGLDRGGFRTLVLLPTPRWRTLLARNLALMPLSFVTAAALLAVVRFLAPIRWETMLASVFQYGSAACLFALVCNTLAILLPYRMKPGTLQASKATGAVFFVGFGTMLVLPILFGLLVLPALLQGALARFPSLAWLPLNAAGSALLLALSLAAYARLLPLQGRLLQRREQLILQRVTEELE